MSEIGEAERRALRLYPRSRNFRKAYVRGARARIAGLPADVCPYKRDPGKTWRGTYRRAWLAGWESVPMSDEESPPRPPVSVS